MSLKLNKITESDKVENFIKEVSNKDFTVIPIHIKDMTIGLCISCFGAYPTVINEFIYQAVGKDMGTDYFTSPFDNCGADRAEILQEILVNKNPFNYFFVGEYDQQTCTFDYIQEEDEATIDWLIRMEVAEIEKEEDEERAHTLIHSRLMYLSGAEIMELVEPHKQENGFNTYFCSVSICTSVTSQVNWKHLNVVTRYKHKKPTQYQIQRILQHEFGLKSQVWNKRSFDEAFYFSAETNNRLFKEGSQRMVQTIECTFDEQENVLSVKNKNLSAEEIIVAQREVAANSKYIKETRNLLLQLSSTSQEAVIAYCKRRLEGDKNEK